MVMGPIFSSIFSSLGRKVTKSQMLIYLMAHSLQLMETAFETATFLLPIVKIIMS